MKTEWIAVDWGTTALRAWAMVGGAVVDLRHSDRGMGRLQPSEFEAALLDLVSDWLGAEATPVVACGMVGSRQGWVEAPYSRVPCKPLTTTVTAPTTDPRLRVDVISGLAQDTPPDVMRGEETQIAGFLALNPSFDGILCLPGTHTKWVHMSAGEVVSFRTVMSGEVFAAISTQTVLRHSLDTQEMDREAFDAALSETMTRPETFARDLFGLRAADLLTQAPPQVARARLSGGLIGLELAATKPYWLGQPVAIIGAPALSALYERSLRAQGVICEQADADEVTRAGLHAAYLRIQGIAS
ncbi:2-dehydro-3-deoxygalactonokinase [Celeribacter arenosi]|uniref:2-dehydro-3-deoxygalactonokinase n=1 Tax=Celeribacter arenosi TaxID=792649 RepID=A0ABP7K1E1_9RHOB